MNTFGIAVLLLLFTISATAAEDCPLLETPAGWSPAKWFWKCGDRRCEPPYPETAKNNGLEGRVLMLVTIQSDGVALFGEVLESSGHEVLDSGALKHVMRIRYPIQVDSATGRAICHKVKVPMAFTLPSKRRES